MLSLVFDNQLLFSFTCHFFLNSSSEKPSWISPGSPGLFQFHGFVSVSVGGPVWTVNSEGLEAGTVSIC